MPLLAGALLAACSRSRPTDSATDTGRDAEPADMFLGVTRPLDLPGAGGPMLDVVWPLEHHSGGPPGVAPVLPWRAVHVQYDEGCALDDYGFAWCGDSWGLYEYYPYEPPDDGGFVSIAVGQGSACALDGAGVPTCWGLIEDPDPNLVFRQVSVHGQWACGVEREGGGIACWGVNERGAPPARVEMADADFVQAVVIYNTLYALDSLGRPTRWDSVIPGYPPMESITVTDLGSVAGVARDGTQLCVAGVSGSDFASCVVANLSNDVCAVDLWGWASCYGYTDQLSGVAESRAWRDLSYGLGACGIARGTGELLCWGDWAPRIPGATVLEEP